MAPRADDIERPVVCSGKRITVVAAVRRNGTCPSIQFLDGLSPSDSTKLYALFQRYADDARINNGRKFKRLEDNIWEFKARGRDTGLRVTCYRNGDLLILLSGFRKNEDATEPREVSLATSIMEEDQQLHGG